MAYINAPIRKKPWVIPTFLVGYAMVFALCWIPVLYGWITNDWAAAGLGMLSGAPFCVALPFISHRVLDGRWAWE